MIAVSITTTTWWIIADYFSFNTAFLLAIWISVTWFFVSLFLTEPDVLWNTNKKKKTLSKNTLDSFWYLLSKRKLFLIVFFAWLFMFPFAFFDDSLNPFYELIWIPVLYFWIIYSAYNLIWAWFANYTDRIEKYLWEKKSLILSFWLPWIALILMWYFPWIYTLAFWFSRWFWDIFFKALINENVDSSNRSTILSVSSMFNRIFKMPTLPLIWVAMDLYWVAYSYFIVWWIMVFGMIFAYLFLNKLLKN